MKKFSNVLLIALGILIVSLGVYLAFFRGEKSLYLDSQSITVEALD